MKVYNHYSTHSAIYTKLETLITMDYHASTAHTNTCTHTCTHMHTHAHTQERDVYCFCPIKEPKALLICIRTHISSTSLATTRYSESPDSIVDRCMCQPECWWCWLWASYPFSVATPVLWIETLGWQRHHIVLQGYSGKSSQPMRERNSAIVGVS